MPRATSWAELTSPEGEDGERLRTDLIGRRAIVVRPTSGVGGPQRADVGHRAIIRSVGYDAVHSPCYTLELEDGTLAESSAANFKLLDEPGAAEGP